MHVDLAAFEPSADGHKYCLVAAVTVEIDKESNLLPMFAPMPRKDSVSRLAAIKEALTVYATTETYTRSPAQELSTYRRTVEENSTTRSSMTFALTRTSPYPSHLPISPLRTALQREWLVCSRPRSVEKVLGRPWNYPKERQLVGIWKGHDKDQAKSHNARGAMGYLLDIDIWQSGTTRIMQDGIVVKGLAPKPLDPLRYHVNPRCDLHELEKGMPWRAVQDEFTNPVG